MRAPCIILRCAKLTAFVAPTAWGSICVHVHAVGFTWTACLRRTRSVAIGHYASYWAGYDSVRSQLCPTSACHSACVSTQTLGHRQRLSTWISLHARSHAWPSEDSNAATSLFAAMRSSMHAVPCRLGPVKAVPGPAVLLRTPTPCARVSRICHGGRNATIFGVVRSLILVNGAGILGM
jgi:hypothetical protein